jgi:demethylmenaquinone methyltransferase/2-methoxy-6-polyprenyl-1,4-benzoquinol methylase
MEGDGRVRHFDLIAPVYDRLMIPAFPQRLRSLLKLPVSGRMLDAGGGTGRVSAGLQGLVGQLVICDISLPMLTRARVKRGLTPVNARAEQLPFGDAAFDRILVVDALHHFQHPAGVLTELMRLLKPGGRMVIEEPDIRRKLVKLVALAEKLALMRSRFYPAEEIARIIRSAGGRTRIERDRRFAAWVVVDF